MFIYILELDNNKYYVGRTNNVENRINEHKNNGGSSWTKKYKFISLVDSFQTNDPFDEDKWVKKYMKEYGIENVRGGSYVTNYLDSNTIDFINREIRGASDRCFKCGGMHFVSNCDSNNKIIDNLAVITEKSDFSNSNTIHMINKTKNYLRDNAKGQWLFSYRIKDVNTDNFMHELNGVAILIRVNYPDMLGFFWMYKMSDAHLLIEYVHKNIHLETHEIIINDRIKLFYDIDMEITDSELQDMIDYYEVYSNETNLTIDDVARHLAHLYFDATLASLEEHGNDLEQMHNIVDIMYTTRNRPVSNNDKFKISIHLITNIVCDIQECKAIVEHVRNAILYHPDEYGLEYPDNYCEMIVNAIDVQPYHRFGSLAIHGGKKIVNNIEYINEIQQQFQLKSEEPFITRFDNVPTNISFKEYDVVITQNYNSNATVSKEFIDIVLSHIHKIPYYNANDWDLDAATYKGCTAIVKRLNPSYCEICERQHDLDNTLILVFNEEWQTGAWKCMHNRNIKSRVFFRDYTNANDLDQYSDSESDCESDHSELNKMITGPDNFLLISEGSAFSDSDSDDEIELNVIIDTPGLIQLEQDYSDSESESDESVETIYKYSDDPKITIDVNDGYESDTDMNKQSIAKKESFDSKSTVSAVLHYQKREYIL